MKTVLKTTNLTKSFGGNKGAFNVNIDLKEGEIVGFLGPNGAGKTTTIRMILGLLKPDSGGIEIFSKNIQDPNDLQEIITKINFLPGDPTFYDGIKVSDILNYSASLSSNIEKDYLIRLIEIFDLDIQKTFNQLSLGNKKKVGLINAIMTKPKLLILDEPTNSLDPIMQQKVLKEILQLKKDGTTIFFSSHVLSEVEKISDKIVLIKDGQILLQGNTKEILKNNKKKIVIETENKSELIKSLFNNQYSIDINGNFCILTEDLRLTLNTLLENGIEDFYIERLTLEDIFLKHYE